MGNSYIRPKQWASMNMPVANRALPPRSVMSLWKAVDFVIHLAQSPMIMPNSVQASARINIIASIVVFRFRVYDKYM